MGLRFNFTRQHVDGAKESEPERTEGEREKRNRRKAGAQGRVSMTPPSARVITEAHPRSFFSPPSLTLSLFPSLHHTQSRLKDVTQDRKSSSILKMANDEIPSPNRAPD